MCRSVSGLYVNLVSNTISLTARRDHTINRLLGFAFIFACTLILQRPDPLHADAARTDSKIAGRHGRVINMLVILVEFPDIPHTVQTDFAQKRFFKDLNGYIQEMSYGKHGLQGDVTEKWYRLPHPVSRYKISPRNLEVDRSRVKKLVEDVLDAVAGDVDFSQYDLTAFFFQHPYGVLGSHVLPFLSMADAAAGHFIVDQIEIGLAGFIEDPNRPTGWPGFAHARTA